MAFNGANINERMDVSANGGRVRFTRDIANIVMDLNDVERIDVKALGGADTITVNDLSGTDASTCGRPQRRRRRRRRRGRQRHRQRHQRRRRRVRHRQRPERIRSPAWPRASRSSGAVAGSDRADGQRARPATTWSTPPAWPRTRSLLTLNGGDGDDILHRRRGQRHAARRRRRRHPARRPGRRHDRRRRPATTSSCSSPGPPARWRARRS